MLTSALVKEVLPELVTMLHASDTAQPVEVTTVCQILNNLSQVSVQNARTVLNNGVLPRIIQISSKERYPSNINRQFIHVPGSHGRAFKTVRTIESVRSDPVRLGADKRYRKPDQTWTR